MNARRLAPGFILAFLAAGLTPVLTVPEPARAEEPKLADYVEELNFYNTDLHLVLKALSERTGYPFVEDIPVDGKVTVHISKKTSIAEVLDQILRGLNLSWTLDRGVYHVQPRKPVKGTPLGRGLVARTFSLETIAADDAAEAVRPLLSEFGKVAVDGGMNALTVTDVPEVLDSVKNILDGLDVEGRRPAQISIQTKVLQILRQNTLRWGAVVEWDKYNAMEGIGSRFLAGNLNNAPGWGESGGMGSANGAYQNQDEYYAYYPDAFTFKVGSWGIDQLVSRFFLDSRVYKTNVLSEPDVTVLSDTEARIMVGVKVPHVLSSGFQYEDTGVILKVKPSLGDQGRIYMELNPAVTEALNGPDLLANREVSIKVEVVSGSTIRIGGLVDSWKHTIEQKVPVLGDLPLLGYLFKWSYNADYRNEIVILVSPHIVEHIPPRCAATAGISALSANLVVGTTDVLLDWSEDVPFDNVGVVRYHVYRDVRPIMSTANLVPLTREVRGDVTSWVDLTLKRRGVTYYYAVTALDGAGNEESVSNSPSITVPKR
ncbi:MAG: secretin N-terminal domain-containing protein [Candidatus Coatesbacteria bacterium]